jgi:hypothetical protein
MTKYRKSIIALLALALIINFAPRASCEESCFIECCCSSKEEKLEPVPVNVKSCCGSHEIPIPIPNDAPKDEQPCQCHFDQNAPFDTVPEEVVVPDSSPIFALISEPPLEFNGHEIVRLIPFPTGPPGHSLPLFLIHQQFLL